VHPIAPLRGAEIFGRPIARAFFVAPVEGSTRL
jgi:hypothetical protein